MPMEGHRIQGETISGVGEGCKIWAIPVKQGTPTGMFLCMIEMMADLSRNTFRPEEI